MCEYLFRGKRKDNGEWVDGDLIYEPWGSCIQVIKNDNINTFKRTKYSVHKETVGQYTGLKDKNGKTIFEGDIVLFGETPLVVYWNGESFGWCAKAEQYPFRRFPSCRDWDYIDLGWIAAEAPCTGEITTEIIGNIHDNPELLKEGGEE